MQNIPIKNQFTFLENIEQNVGFYTSEGKLKDEVNLKDGQYQTGFWTRILAKGEGMLSRIVYSKEKQEQKLANIISNNFTNLMIDVGCVIK